MIETVSGKRFMFVRARTHPGNFAPYSTAWQIEAEHIFSPKVQVRVNYVVNQSGGIVVLNSQVVRKKDALVLSGRGESRYRQLEFTTVLTPRAGQKLFLSYVHSEAQGDLNDLSRYLGEFPSPVVQPNQFSALPRDLPDRGIPHGVRLRARQCGPQLCGCAVHRQISLSQVFLRRYTSFQGCESQR